MREGVLCVGGWGLSRRTQQVRVRRTVCLATMDRRVALLAGCAAKIRWRICARAELPAAEARRAVKRRVEAIVVTVVA
jgi:hypothetical protein